MKKSVNQQPTTATFSVTDIGIKLDEIAGQVLVARRNMATASARISITARDLRAFEEELNSRGPTYTIDLNQHRAPSYGPNPKQWREDRLEKKDLEKLQARRKEDAEARKEFEVAKSLLADLQAEQIALETDLFSVGATTATEELLRLQRQVVDISAQQEQLAAALRVQEDAIATAKSSIPSMAELVQKREDVLAAIATGAAGHEELTAIDLDIAVREEAIALAKKDADEVARNAEQTVVGLKRKMTALKETLDVLFERKRRALLFFFDVEAMKIGQAYLDLAAALTGKLRQLLALDIIRREKGFEGIALGNWSGSFIPRFEMSIHKGLDTITYGGLDLANPLLLERHLESDVATEVERIKLLGVDV